jgi:hypothetical protein
MGAANGVGVPPVSEGVTMVGVLSMADEAPRGVGAGGVLRVRRAAHSRGRARSVTPSSAVFGPSVAERRRTMMFSVAQAAEVCGVSPNAVRSVICRGELAALSAFGRLGR